MNCDYRICKRCVMDTSDPNIRFDENGFCNHCSRYFERLPNRPTVQQGEAEVARLVAKIKADGKGKEYDCILGLSGGCDSSYLAFKVVELGLRPLTLHFDSGWNSELSVQNIEKIINHLKLDLFTIVCDWEEMKDLQRSFFLASLVNCDIPQDHAFIATLNKVAVTHGVHSWISGHDYWGSESIMASAWRGYDSRDWKHIQGVHQAMGGKKLVNYPHYNWFELFIYYPLLKGVKPVNLFDHLRYNKIEAKEFLKKTIQWKDYEGKHNESVFTRFFQGHYLPAKFGYDKRRCHLASLVVSGQITRDEALQELSHDFYTPNQLQDDKQFVLKKLGFTAEQWSAIMAAPAKNFRDYPNDHRLFEIIQGTRRSCSKGKSALLRRK